MRTESRLVSPTVSWRSPWLWAGLSLLILGLTFRLSHLDHKIFWVDEVATAIRIAGYTRAEVTQQLSDGQWHTPSELLAYQQLQPDRAWSDLFHALSQSPEHAPLYFLLLRGWTAVWGSSVVALRSFSLLCSLLLLVAMAGLSRFLFRRPAAGFTAGLVAISPVFIAYAQEARPYSLWMLLIALSSSRLLAALQRNCWRDWGLHGITLALSLYTSLLSIGVAIGQVLYVVWFVIRLKRQPLVLRRFGVSLGLAIGTLLPWLWLLSQQWSTLQANTTWMRLPLPDWARIVIWFYSAAILYFDVPVVLQPWWIAVTEVAVATIVVLLIGAGFYAVYRRERSAFWFLICLGLPVPLLLLSLDLISDGRYSTAPRYLLPFHLAAQLAVGWLLSDRWRQFAREQHKQEKPRSSWRSLTALILCLCLLSNALHWQRSPRYLKNRNLHNPDLAAAINSSNLPLVSEASNSMDLLSLSHLLDADQPIAILPTPDRPDLPVDPDRLASLLAARPSDHCRLLLFNPSPDLKQELSDRHWQLTERYFPALLLPGEFALSLWQVELPRSEC